MTDFISVIVPVYNAENYLGDCIQALQSQTYPEDRYQIIMIDNNSVDGSCELIRKYPNVLLELEQQQGAYAARNRGIDRAKGNILAFTDPDCIPDKNWLRNISTALHDQKVQIVMGKNLFPGRKRALYMLQEYEAGKADYILSGANPLLYYGYTNNMAVRTEVFGRVGNFSRILRGADVILVRRVVDLFSCSAVRFVPTMQVQHSEIKNVRTYYHKRYIYGKSYKKYHNIFSARSLPAKGRWQVFNNVRNRNKHTIFESMYFLGLLLGGAICYEMGRL